MVKNIKVLRNKVERSVVKAFIYKMIFGGDKDDYCFSDKFLILFATSRPFISCISISRKTTSYGFWLCRSRKDTAFKYLSKEISISNSLKQAFIFLLKQSRYTFHHHILLFAYVQQLLIKIHKFWIIFDKNIKNT